MKATELQEAARKRNWALFQLRSSRGNLYRALTQAGIGTFETACLMQQLTDMEESVKRKFSAKRTELLRQQIKTLLEDK